MDRFAEAEMLLQSTLATFLAGGQGQRVAQTKLNLGMLAYRDGRYQKALDYLNSAYDGFAAGSVLADMAIVDLKRGLIYSRLFMFQEAVKLATEAGRVLKRHRMRREYTTSLLQQGTAYQYLGQFELAERRFNQARWHLRKQAAWGKLLALDVQRAELAWKMNQPGRSAHIAHRIGRNLNSSNAPSLAGRIQLLLARCALAKRQWTQAEEYLQSVHTLVNTYHLAELFIEAAHVTGLLYEQQNQLAMTLKQYQLAIEKTRELQIWFSLDDLQLGFIESKRPIYQDSVRLAHQLAEAGQLPLSHLLFALNQAHTAPLVQRPADGSAVDTTSSWQSRLMELRHTWQWYQSKLDTLGHGMPASPEESHPNWPEQLAHLEAEIAELMRQERVRLAALPDTLTLDDSISPETLLHEIQTHLSQGECLLNYFVVNGRFQALLVAPQTIHLIPDLAATEQLERLMKGWRFSLQISPQSADRTWLYLHHLHQVLLAPLQERLAETRHLYLVLPPDWADIPFAALFDGNRYLVEQSQITYLSAPAALFKTRHKPTLEKGEALVVGFSDNGRLPHAPAEAQHISQHLATNRPVTCLVEEAATLESFRTASRRASLIHLATHAFFRPDNPLFSWMRLADDHCTVGDLYHLTLPQHPLVVLSACETGKGQAYGGAYLV